MDEDLEVEVERAIADAATLLLRVDKYRRGREADVVAIGSAIADLGARARRAHRTGRGAAAMPAFLDEVRALTTSLERTITEVLEAPAYRDAVAAYGRADEAMLRPLLFEIFADLGDGPAAGDLYLAVDWSGRRGPRPTEDVLAAIDLVRGRGFVAGGDALTPGTDPELPAVTFRTAWPDGAPIAFACRAEHLGGRSMLGPGGEVLLHRPTVQTAFTIAFQTDRDAVDDWVEDLEEYRAALAPELDRRGYSTMEIPAPAAP